MDDILNSLKNIGLNDKQGKVYLSLLKLGESVVGDIADEAGVKRPTTYLILDELRKKGLVLKIPHAKKAIYQAKSADELYEHSVDSLNKFEKILPKLRSISPSPKTIKTLYFEGITGVKEAMNYKLDKLKDSTVLGFFAKNDGNMSETVLDVFHKWNSRSEKMNVTIAGVTPDHPSTRYFREMYPSSSLKMIYIPRKDYDADISIEITPEFVRIVDAYELKALIIENPRLSEALSQIYKIVRKKYQSI